jgi:hypothetical protein
MCRRPSLVRIRSETVRFRREWLGADLNMLESAGLGNELPATLIVDQQGDIVARVLGQEREGDIRRPLDWLLDGKNGSSPEAVVKHY